MTGFTAIHARLFAAAAMLLACLQADAQQAVKHHELAHAGSATQVSEQVTFLYYDDLSAPRQFYSALLGAKPYYEKEWVSLYHTSSGASVGLVKSGTTASPTDKRAAVMVSIVTQDVKAWYERLSRDPRFQIVKALYDHPMVPIRAFEMEDPAGYPVEVFQWLQKPE